MITETNINEPLREEFIAAFGNTLCRPTCNICYSSFSATKSPRVFSCGHTVCKVCISKIKISPQLQQQNMTKCPHCNTITTNVPNFSLQEVAREKDTELAAMREKVQLLPIACSDCPMESKKTLSLFCRTCVSPLCVTCIPKHVASICQNSQLVEVKEYLQVADMIKVVESARDSLAEQAHVSGSGAMSQLCQRVSNSFTEQDVMNNLSSLVLSDKLNSRSALITRLLLSESQGQKDGDRKLDVRALLETANCERERLREEKKILSRRSGVRTTPDRNSLFEKFEKRTSSNRKKVKLNPELCQQDWEHTVVIDVDDEHDDDDDADADADNENEDEQEREQERRGRGRGRTKAKVKAKAEAEARLVEERTQLLVDTTTTGVDRCQQLPTTFKNLGSAELDQLGVFLTGLDEQTLVQRHADIKRTLDQKMVSLESRVISLAQESFPPVDFRMLATDSHLILPFSNCFQYRMLPMEKTRSSTLHYKLVLIPRNFIVSDTFKTGNELCVVPRNQCHRVKNLSIDLSCSLKIFQEQKDALFKFAYALLSCIVQFRVKSLTIYITDLMPKDFLQTLQSCLHCMIKSSLSREEKKKSILNVKSVKWMLTDPVFPRWHSRQPTATFLIEQISDLVELMKLFANISELKIDLNRSSNAFQNRGCFITYLYPKFAAVDTISFNLDSKVLTTEDVGLLNAFIALTEIPDYHHNVRLNVKEISNVNHYNYLLYALESENWPQKFSLRTSDIANGRILAEQFRSMQDSFVIESDDECVLISYKQRHRDELLSQEV